MKLLAAGLALCLCAGCASLLQLARSHREGAKATAEPRPVEAREVRSPAALELQKLLASTQASQVVVSRKLLSSLLEAEQGHQARCERLSDQLEALKNIDGEEPKKIIQ